MGFDIIRNDLTPALRKSPGVLLTGWFAYIMAARLNAMVRQEVDNAVREYMPPCEDWTEVCINSTLLEIVAKVSGFVFAGSEMSKSPEYIDACKNYTVHFMTAVSAIKAIRPWLKPFLAPRVPELRRVRECKNQVIKILTPIVEERMRLKATDPNWQQPDDMLQSMIDRSNRKDRLAEIADCQLGLIFAAIHTTTMTVTNILYSLAVTPEYLEPIRNEVRKDECSYCRC